MLQNGCVTFLRAPSMQIRREVPGQGSPPPPPGQPPGGQHGSAPQDILARTSLCAGALAGPISFQLLVQHSVLRSQMAFYAQ